MSGSGIAKPPLLTSRLEPATPALTLLAAGMQVGPPAGSGALLVQLPEADGSGAVGCVLGQTLLGTAYEHVLLAALEGLR